MQTEQIDHRVKVTPEEVRQEIAGTHATAAELAEKFEVKRETIQRKIKDLRRDNEPVIHTGEGYILINKEWLENEGNASDLEKYQMWIIKTLKGLRGLSQPIRPLLPQMRRTLSLNMSREERHELMQGCAKITALLAFTEVEEGLNMTRYEYLENRIEALETRLDQLLGRPKGPIVNRHAIMTHL